MLFGCNCGAKPLSGLYGMRGVGALPQGYYISGACNAPAGATVPYYQLVSPDGTAQCLSDAAISVYGTAPNVNAQPPQVIIGTDPLIIAPVVQTPSQTPQQSPQQQQQQQQQTQQTQQSTTTANTTTDFITQNWPYILAAVGGVVLLTSIPK